MTENIAKRIKIIRKKLGKTQEEFGKSIEVSKQAINNVESKKSNPSIVLLNKLLVILNVNLNYLIGGIGEPFIHEQPKFNGDLKASILAEVEEMLKDLGITKD